MTTERSRIAHDDAFAEHRGQDADAQVDGVAADREADAAVLRHAAFGDVEVRHDLDARRDGKGQVPRRRHHFIQDAIGADADLELVLERLEMQVAGMVLDGHQEDHVQELANRGAIGKCLLGGEVEHALLQGRRGSRQVVVLLHVGNHLLDAFAPGRIIPRQGLQHVPLRRHHRPHFATEEAPQLVDDRELLRIAHGDGEHVVLEADGHDAVELGHGLRDHGQNVGGHDQVGQADHLQAHLFAQPLHEVFFAEQAHANGHLAEEFGGPLPLLLKDHLHPLFGEETKVDQDLSDASQCHVRSPLG